MRKAPNTESEKNRKYLPTSFLPASAFLFIINLQLTHSKPPLVFCRLDEISYSCFSVIFGLLLILWQANLLGEKGPGILIWNTRENGARHSVVRKATKFSSSMLQIRYRQQFMLPTALVASNRCFTIFIFRYTPWLLAPFTSFMFIMIHITFLIISVYRTVHMQPITLGVACFKLFRIYISNVRDTYNNDICLIVHKY